MSAVGFRNEVRFSDRRMDPVTLDIPFTDQSSSLSSRSRHSCDGATPRSILKTRNSVQNWLHNRSSTEDADDVFDGVSQSFLPGLSDWIQWRTQLNEAMVDLIEERHRIFSYPGSVRHLQKHERVMKNLVEPDFLIGRRASEFALQRAVHDYVTGKEGFHLQAPTFISFGLPRVRLRPNSTFIPDDNRAGSVSSGTLTGSDSPKPPSDNSSITKAVIESSTESESVHSTNTARKVTQTVPSKTVVDVTSTVLPPKTVSGKTVVDVTSTVQPSSQPSAVADTAGVGSEHVDTESLCAILDIRDESEYGFGI